MADDRRIPPPDPADAPQMESLLTETLATYAHDIEPPADALARMQTHLATAKPARQSRPGAIRWAIAGAVALVLLLLLSPIGRATASGIGHAARNVIVTMRDTVTGNSGGELTPARGTRVTGTSVPSSATTGTGTATAGSGSATARASGTVTGTITGTVVGTSRSGKAPATTATGATAATGTPASMPAPLLLTAPAPTTATPANPMAGTSPPP